MTRPTYTGLHACCHAGPYVTSIGVLAMLARYVPLVQCRWVGCGYLDVDLPAEELAGILCQVARDGDWAASLDETGHIAFAQTGRRVMRQWVPIARRHLESLPLGSLWAELHGVLHDTPALYSMPRGLPPNQKSGDNPRYGGGGLWPSSIGFNGSPGMLLSAWHAALAWEAKAWMADGLPIDKISQTPGWMSGREQNIWWAPIWDGWTEVRRCRAFFRPRGKHSPQSWNLWRHLFLRDERHIGFIVRKLITGSKSFELLGPLQPAENTMQEMKRHRAALHAQHQSYSRVTKDGGKRRGRPRIKAAAGSGHA